MAERLKVLADTACLKAKVDLLETDVFRAGARKTIRLFIDKDGGVSVEDCANCSRILSEMLEAEPELIDGAFTLEVSSPGLDRPLKSKRDFERNLGRTLKIVREKEKPTIGVLKSVNDSHIVLEIVSAKKNKVETEFSIKDLITVKVEP